ncbi:MAG: ABC transporter permease subunit [Planctomycetes bacterium]|nr:ABC transporter permease subunit [Planctomycetota bacterium]
MFAYIIRRLIYMPFILFGVILITFALFELTSTPESQALTHIGEKASQRQVYDWLEGKNLISWTEAGEKKVEATSNGKLPPKAAHFLAKSFLEDTPNELAGFNEYAHDMEEDVDDLLEDYEISAGDVKAAITAKHIELKIDNESKPDNSELAVIADNVRIFADLDVKISLLQAYAGDKKDKDLIKDFNRLRGRQGDKKNESVKLAAKWSETISSGRNEYLILAIGDDTFQLATKYENAIAGLKSTEQRLLAKEAVFIDPKGVQGEISAETDTVKKKQLEAKLSRAKKHFVDIAKLQKDLATAKDENKDTKELETALAAANVLVADSAKEITETKSDVKKRLTDVAKLKADGEPALAVKNAAQKEANEAITSFADIKADFTYTSSFVKFQVYIWDIMTLNLGDTKGGRPVTSVIYEGMWPSLMLTLPAFFLAELIGVFFGLFAAMYRRTKVDTTIIVSSILLMSINAIALIMFGQKFIAADLNYFPVTGFAEGLGAVRFLMLPIFLYIVITFGERIRFNRIVMLDETNQDYVRTARAKGVGENSVLFKHVFRNTLIPLITRWAVAIPSLYMGSLVLESFFSIPGLGYMTVDAIQNSDANIIRTVVVFGSISFMLANLVSDVLYAVADPRVKLS